MCRRGRTGLRQSLTGIPGSGAEITASAFWRAAHRCAGKCDERLAEDAAEESFWQARARGYDDKSPLAECAADLIGDLRDLLAGHGHLLEIGAGPGAFTRRLKAGLRRITIVEPSAAMRAQFQRLWDGPAIVETLSCKWEEAREIEADVVFGANAFYRIEDIATALRRMNAAAQYRVALVQSVGRPHAAPLVAEIDGAARSCERADALSAVLSELGIDHNRRDYDVRRPDGPSRAALIDWAPRMLPD